MRILILTLHTPARQSEPGSPRLFSLCRELSRDHELELLLMSPDAERMTRFGSDPEVGQVFSRVDGVPAAPVPSWLRRQVHRLRQEPHYSVRALAPAHYSRVCAEVRRRCAEVDLLIADDIRTTQYVRDVPVPAVVDLHDAVSLLLRRRARLAEGSRERARLHLGSSATARWERRLHRHFELAVTNADVDRDEIRRLDPRCKVVTIPNGVDTAYFTPGTETPERARLVFTGVMGYGPNDDAARFFIHDVLPRVRELEPDCEFWTVGHAPSQSLLAMDGSAGVRITGTVPDVRPFVRAARVFVCPLRYGTGIKNKILAAMAMGCPVLATPLSLDGIDCVPEEHVLVADSPAELARQSLRLIRDDDLVSRLSDSARAWVVENCSWSRQAGRFGVELAKLGPS